MWWHHSYRQHTVVLYTEPKDWVIYSLEGYNAYDICIVLKHDLDYYKMDVCYTLEIYKMEIIWLYAYVYIEFDRGTFHWFACGIKYFSFGNLYEKMILYCRL